MNEVSAIIDLPVLMLHCPKCKWRFPVKLPAFASATKEGKYISCAACGNEYSVKIELLDRVAEQQRDGAEAGTCPECMGSGEDLEDSSRACYECNGIGHV